MTPEETLRWLVRNQLFDRSIAFSNHPAHGFPRGNSSLLGTVSRQPIGGRNRSHERSEKEASPEETMSSNQKTIHRSRSPATPLTAFQEGTLHSWELGAKQPGGRNRSIDKGSNDTRKQQWFPVKNDPSIDQSRSPATPTQPSKEGTLHSWILMQQDPEDAIDRSIRKQAQTTQVTCFMGQK